MILSNNARICYKYQEAGINVLTENWLHLDMVSSLIEVFPLLGETEQQLWEKVEEVEYVNMWICERQVVPTVHRATVCNPDIELLCLSLRPFYLPREFRNIIVCADYVPSSANTTRAAGYITESIHDKLQCTPGALFFILGDFNHCKLKLVLPG